MPSSTVDKLFHGEAFRPEDIDLLREAYARACKSLHDRGQPSIVTEIIAQRIIALAKRGERDPDRLSEAALIALGTKNPLS